MRGSEARAAAIERVWFGSGVGAAASRMALSPLAALFGMGTGGRNALYDRGWLQSRALQVPAISVGNLTVGGTGKTPVAAWIAGALQARGRRPGIVLRGYGDDEPRVHAHLTPGAVVIADPDRVRGAAAAVAAGAQALVLDDAFQHRRARRDVDLVLVSADRWSGDVRLLPAGPFREPLVALRRAHLVMITRRATSREQAEEVAAAVAPYADGAPVLVGALLPDTLHPVPGVGEGAGDDVPRTLRALRGTRVLAIAGIGDPASLFAQLRQTGAEVEEASFPDHHAYTEGDIGALVRRAERTAALGGTAVCTLKDAVKLAARWPRAAVALWYVSQRLYLESGGAELEQRIAALASR